MDTRTRWLQVEWPTVTTMIELPISADILSELKQLTPAHVAH